LKTIVITGASRGIGRAISLRLASEDANLYLHGRNSPGLSETQRLCKTKGAITTLVIADIADGKGVEAIANAVGNRIVDVLVNNAGVALTKPFDEISLDEWNRVVAVNLTAPFYLSKLLSPRMVAGSAIVNISSGAAYTAFPNQSAYCATKFGLEGFSDCAREELRARKIRLISIYPAATYTDMWRAIPGDWPTEKMLTPEDVAESVAYVLAQPAQVQVEFLRISNIAGRL
jgi:NAD(P)-dependent dehydrogenase (short-subunit alcohol dehydrogenase family)